MRRCSARGNLHPEELAVWVSEADEDKNCKGLEVNCLADALKRGRYLPLAVLSLKCLPAQFV